ncbi:MAG TPA: hypothetical protein VHT50_10290 [Mycobacterium sp.]|nr:hypothetical protein [Mycobacterium sp.]
MPTYRQQQQQEQQRRQHALAGAAPGSFIDLHLERLISIGGEGLLQPRSIRQAPATALVNGSVVAVADMVVDQGTPEFWVRYLFDELVSTGAKNALPGFAGRNLLLDFYNRVFWRPDDFETAPKPFVVPKATSVLAAYPAATTGHDLLRSHLRAALDLGFEWMQWPADTTGSSNASLAGLVSYMQEIQHKTVHTPLVWRTEDRRTLAELRRTGFTQQVAAQQRIEALGMDQAWNPYSTDEVRGRLWYRRQNTDNCLYTGISVALHPFASLVFPKITLSPTTLAPVANAVYAAIARGAQPESVLLDANGEVLPKFAPYIARLALPGNQFKLCLYSRARTILMALEGKYLDTQGVQSMGQRDRSQAFPEYGCLGIAGSNVFAQIELHRFFHGWRDDEGFTAFVNTSACELVDRDAIVACFGEARAQTDYYAKVQQAYNEVANNGPYGLAWAAGGMGHTAVRPQYETATAAWVDGRRIALH